MEGVLGAATRVVMATTRVVMATTRVVMGATLAMITSHKLQSNNADPGPGPRLNPRSRASLIR